MDSRRFLLAITLMIAVMFAVNLIFPGPRPTPATNSAADSLVVAPPPVAPDTTPGAGAAPVSPAAVPPAAVPGLSGTAVTADTLSVRSPLFDYVLSTQGAALLGAELLEFPVLREGHEGEAVQLAAPGHGPLFSYALRIGTRDIPFNTLGFDAEPDAGLELTPSDSNRAVQLSHRGDDGLGVDVLYTFDPDNYLIHVRMAVTGTGGQTPTLYISLPRTLARNEDDIAGDERALAYVVNNEREGISSVRLNTIDTQRVVDGPLLWAAVKNKYFVAAALSPSAAQGRFGGLIATPVQEPNAADMSITLLPGGDGTFSFQLFIGPQEPQRLAQLENSFQDVNPFGWRAFRPVLRPFVHAIQWALYGLHNLLGVGYGWVLILFGVIIRVALWPLNAKAMRSQMKTMEIQPKLKAIQEKYRNQPDQLQKEMVRLYREEGFNPMGGCLPMLIPLPILITLFFVFQSTIAFRGVGFLWLPDLSRADPLYILPIVLGISMFLMQWVSTRSMPEQNPQMKVMMYVMPIVMVVLFFRFPSGLNLYYASMNFASIPQQIQIARERKKFQASKAR